MNNEKLVELIEEKRTRYMISKQSLSKLININANFFRDILRNKEKLPKSYYNRVYDFIELPFDDYLNKYQGDDNNVKNKI